MTRADTIPLCLSGACRSAGGSPALAFVNNLTHSDAHTLSYVTVYPLATLLRILTTQTLALLLVH